MVKITAKVGPDQIDITNQYLAVLAMEYKILSRNNQSTNETIKEIYHFIRTLNRLDAYADLVWNLPLPASDDLFGQPQNNNLNGYMLREDMPWKYFWPNNPNQNVAHFNYELKEHGFDGDHD